MSGYNAFSSFVNYLKTALTGSGITVVTEKDEKTSPPYVVMQMGPDMIKGRWSSALLCQAWVVVAKNDNEPLAVTISSAIDLIVRATTDAGTLPKYDYSQNPTAQIGYYIARVTQVSQDMSDDPERARKVITWELYSNGI